MISHRMFAKAKSTLNSKNLQSGRIRRYAVSTSVFEKLQRPSKIQSHAILHVHIFIYGRQITLLGNKVTGVGTKVFEARPRQSSRCSAFSKTHLSVYVCHLRFLLFALIIPSPSIDLTEGSPEFSRSFTAVELLSRGSSTDRTYSNHWYSRVRFALPHIASHHIATPRGRSGAIGGEKKKIAIGDAVLDVVCFLDG